MSENEEHLNTLEQAVKANKGLSKLYSKQTEAQDKLKTKYADKVKALLDGLSAEVRALVKTGE